MPAAPDPSRLFHALNTHPVGQLLALLASVWVLIRIADPLLDAVLAIGSHLRIPASILGAVVASMATSAPELGTTALSLWLATGETTHSGAVATANVGIGSVVGSAVFNLAVIVGAVGVRGKRVPLEGGVVSRDGLAYGAGVLLLLALMWRSRSALDRSAGLWLLGAYCVYLLWLVNDLIRGRAGASGAEAAEDQEGPALSLAGAVARLLACIAVIAVACHVLVSGVGALSQQLAAGLQLPRAGISSLLSLVVVAAATSMPDLFTSLAALRRGQGSLAVGNALGSNTFDLLVCLGLPYAVAGARPLASETLLMTGYLFGTTVLFLVLTLREPQITERKGHVLLVAYAGFLMVACWLIFS